MLMCSKSTPSAGEGEVQAVLARSLIVYRGGGPPYTRLSGVETDYQKSLVTYTEHRVYCEAPTIYAVLHCLATAFGSASSDDARQNWESSFDELTVANGYLPHEALRKIHTLCAQRDWGPGDKDGNITDHETLFRLRTLISRQASANSDVEAFLHLEEIVESERFAEISMAERVTMLRRFVEHSTRGRKITQLRISPRLPPLALVWEVEAMCRHRRPHLHSYTLR